MAQNPTDKLIDQARAAAVADGDDLEELVDVTIIGDVAMWQTPAPKGYRDPTPVHHDAVRGDVVTMPRGEAIRLAILGYVDPVELGYDPDDNGTDAATIAEARSAGPVDPEAGATSGLDELPVGAPALVAHLTQFPGDATRVLDAEMALSPAKRRRTVLAAAGLADDELEAALDAAAE